MAFLFWVRPLDPNVPIAVSDTLFLRRRRHKDEIGVPTGRDLIVPIDLLPLEADAHVNNGPALAKGGAKAAPATVKREGGTFGVHGALQRILPLWRGMIITAVGVAIRRGAARSDRSNSWRRAAVWGARTLDAAGGVAADGRDAVAVLRARRGEAQWGGAGEEVIHVRKRRSGGRQFSPVLVRTPLTSVGIVVPVSFRCF